MSVVAFKGIVPADTATAGTFTVGYPTGYGKGQFTDTDGSHSMEVNGASYTVAAGKISLSFGASSITVTWSGGYTLTAGTRYVLGINVVGSGNGPGDPNHRLPAKITGVQLSAVTIGVPAVAAANNIATSQSPTTSAVTLNGSLVASSVATLDFPRNVTITSGSNDSGITYTVTGTDEYGVALTETITGGNATIATGAKAFKTVTRVQPNSTGAVGTVTVGTGSKFGLPLFLGNKSFIRAAAVDGVDEVSSCTIVSGNTSQPSATTGDVRGTITFATAPNSSRQYVLVVVGDPLDRGQLGQA